MADHVDLVLAQWGDQRPDLDAAPMAVMCGLADTLRMLLESLGDKTD